MKYEIKVFSSLNILDTVLGSLVLLFVIWAAASCSPLLTAVIITFIAIRAVVEFSHFQLRNDILHMATCEIDHKYGLKGANYEQSIKAVLDVEEMKRNCFTEKVSDEESEQNSDTK